MWIPIVDFILYIPAWILGKPLAEIDPYLMQIGQYKSLVLNYSNLYSLLPDNYDFFATAGLFLSVSVEAQCLLLLLKNNTKIDEKNYITIFLITIMLCVYFLPSMHERYMFAADVISVIYLFSLSKQDLRSIYYLVYQLLMLIYQSFMDLAPLLISK